MPNQATVSRARDAAARFRAAPRWAQASAALAVLPWLVLAAFAALMLADPPAAGSSLPLAQNVLLVGTVVLLLTLVARTLVNAAARPRRRTALLVLAAAVVLWGVGSATFTGSPDLDLLTFPAPGEGFFIAAYAGMAAFLVLDGGHGRVGLRSLLEAGVTCGGAACLGATVLLSPVASRIEGGQDQALLALLYPLIDVLLGLLVLGEAVIRRRRWSGTTWALIASFTLMAVADTSFVLKLNGGAYDFGPGLSLLWGAGLTLLVAGACGARREPAETERAPTAVALAPVAAALGAVVVLTLTRPDGEQLWMQVPALFTLAAAGARLALALKDAHDAAEAFRLTLTDELTELPNRRAVLDRLQQAIDEGSPIALLLADLDGFKDLNDTLGHAAGDTALRVLARRLRAAMPSGVLVARLGGDEFAVVTRAVGAPALLELAQQVRAVVATPLGLHDHTFALAASVGIAQHSAEATSSDLLRHADVAMYQAKTASEGAVVYDPARDEFTTQRLRTAEFLRRGIPGELVAWYQPQVDAGTHEVAGLEALVRWRHPESGLLAPGLFLPVARQSGLMPALTEAVTEAVLADVARWRADGVSVRVSFNVAPPELLSVTLLERLLAMIGAAALPPGSLVVEVTEDSFIADPDRARAALEKIRRAELQVAIDDYGTGFSSLAYLRDLPVHELKLDRSFVCEVTEDPRSRIIVASTAHMADGLGLRTVAEGVEDAATASRLRLLGVDVLQGYHFARPMPGGDVLPWLTAWSAQLAEHSPGSAGSSGSSAPAVGAARIEGSLPPA